MRDTNRLDHFYDVLKYYHKNFFPDWRFTQFIDNLREYYDSDLFYLEEEDFLKYVKDFTKETCHVKL